MSREVPRRLDQKRVGVRLRGEGLPLSTLVAASDFTYIDPFEIQGWPPKEVEEAIAVAGVPYVDLLEGIAGLLLTRSPRFACDLAPMFNSYMHPHNYERPLSSEEESRIRAMIADPEIVDVDYVRERAPLVVLKATTLAVETFIQNRPGWVLKAIPQLANIKAAVADTKH